MIGKLFQSLGAAMYTMIKIHVFIVMYHRYIFSPVRVLSLPVRVQLWDRHTQWLHELYEFNLRRKLDFAATCASPGGNLKSLKRQEGGKQHFLEGQISQSLLRGGATTACDNYILKALSGIGIRAWDNVDRYVRSATKSYSFQLLTITEIMLNYLSIIWLVKTSASALRIRLGVPDQRLRNGKLIVKSVLISIR